MTECIFKSLHKQGLSPQVFLESRSDEKRNTESIAFKAVQKQTHCIQKAGLSASLLTYKFQLPTKALTSENQGPVTTLKPSSL